MAALDTPWTTQMSSPRSYRDGSPTRAGDAPPTRAAFSPTTLGHYPAAAKHRSTILVHQKSPLLIATPPQVTRALAYSYPFISPLNKIVGLLSWTTGDPWESFLFLAGFWAITLYGNTIVRYAGPIVVVAALILGMYARRYSPLSSTGWTGEKTKGRKRGDSEGATPHHKSLEEIVDSLKLFTSRCNILLDPFIRLTDFFSTQRTATSATTRPALTTLFIRILLVTPGWVILTLPPLRIITTKRVVLALGTTALSWHSRPARVTRIILWRSKLVRRSIAIITGLDVGAPITHTVKRKPVSRNKDSNKDANAIAASLAAKRNVESPRVRFTFTLWENQRRWLGIGWTSHLLSYERAAWTDEHLNPADDIEHFELPAVEGGHAMWRWVEVSEWTVEGPEGEDKWIYYDNKWRDGRQGQDGWGRYTRRRKWCRDAELVELSSSTEVTPTPTPRPPYAESTTTLVSDASRSEVSLSERIDTMQDDTQSDGKVRRRTWLGQRRASKAASEKSNATSGSMKSIESELRGDEDELLPFQEQSSEYGLGDDAKMGLS
ncbi:integral peroxisomal membrane peroxin-domain-containing protein [Phyllosticta citriasiana]|uniref:integral peroxisomal membrane peroxin-domain-containing protein n=1 Tax=Phyllosticta citriasiana TaxID=595635 RepID=UPI0030FDE70A